MHDISKLTDRIHHYCPEDGIQITAIPGLKLYRSANAVPRKPVMYSPSICLVAQGTKQLYFGNHTCRYDPSHYLLNSITMPMEAEVLNAEDNAPYLGLSLEIDSYIVGQLMTDMEQHVPTPDAEANEIVLAADITEPLESSFIRLLACLEDPMDQRVLVPTLKREIYYQVLRGPAGYILRNCVANHNGANRIAPVVQYLEQNFDAPLDINQIAGYAGMSPSRLHDNFKRITSQSPMQFVKSLRLHKAHSMLLTGHPVSKAAFQVGYNSPSQFSREFKRFFGESPSDIAVVAR